MAWHFYRRYNSDVSVGGILDNIFDLILCIIPGVGGTVEGVTQPGPDFRPFAGAAYLGQFRIFFYGNAPALIVGQVPMKNIHLVLSRFYCHDFV